MNQAWHQYLANRKASSDKGDTSVFADERTRSVIYDITHLGLLFVSGRDSETFLQGQATCDVSILTEHRSSLGALCNPKGRVITTFTILKTSGSGYLLLLPAELLEPVRQRLQRYVLRSDVRLEDVSDQWCVVGLSGQQPAPLPAEQEIELCDAIQSVARQADWITIRMRSADERFLVLASTARAVTLWEQMADEKQFSEHDSGLWMCHDIADGIPVIAQATSEAFVPQMINLDLLDGISFDKGCYTGQEVVARMHYLGKLKRRMYLGSGTSGQTPNPGDPVFDAKAADEQRVGTIVMAACCAADQYHFLAVLQTASAESGDLRIDSPDGEPMTLRPLPYRLQTQ
jgi:tRNA-modifying protein YgfZ